MLRFGRRWGLRLGWSALSSLVLGSCVVVLSCLLASAASARELPAGGVSDAGAEGLDASVEGAAAESVPLLSSGETCAVRLALCAGATAGGTAPGQQKAMQVPAPPRRVSAAGLLEDDDAPMCDREARSVGGNIEIPEIDSGHFEVLPCESPWLALRANAELAGRDIEHARAALNGAPRPSLGFDERAQKELLCAAPLSFLHGERAALLTAPFAASLGKCSGHPRDVYRPPSARG